jgi:hypothetical protein
MADLQIPDPTTEHSRGDYLVLGPVDATDGELTARSVAPGGSLGRDRRSDPSRVHPTSKTHTAIQSFDSCNRQAPKSTALPGPYRVR